MTGISYNGRKSDGSCDWSGVANVKLMDFELSISFQVYFPLLSLSLQLICLKNGPTLVLLWDLVIFYVNSLFLLFVFVGSYRYIQYTD